MHPFSSGFHHHHTCRERHFAVFPAGQRHLHMAHGEGFGGHRHSDGHGGSGRGGHGGHGGRHGRGGRMFEQGAIKILALNLVAERPCYGYELIKYIETLVGGDYSPSPGVIYPTLDLLQDQQLIIIHEEDGGRKKIAITSQGQAWLAENSEHLQHIQARIKARSVGYQLRKDPQMKRALENFKAVLDLKVNQSEVSAAQLKQIIGIIDRAALDISQLD